MVVVVYGAWEDASVPDFLSKIPVKVVNVNARLHDLISINGVVSLETYGKEYGHWRGSPPELVDAHPNEKAHAILAQEILSVIEASKSDSSAK